MISIVFSETILVIILLLILLGLGVTFLLGKKYLFGGTIVAITIAFTVMCTYTTTHFQTDGLYHSTERQGEFIELVKEITGEQVVHVEQYKPEKNDYLTTQIKDKYYEVSYITNHKEIEIIKIQSNNKVYFDINGLEWGM